MSAKPKSAFPSPAAILPGEADILANVLADLSDDSAKLVYADWLEEHDDTRGPLLREFVTAYRAGGELPVVTAAARPWGNLLGFSIVEKLRNTVLARLTGSVLALARPALAYRATSAAEESLAVGASKLGGRPDLLPDTEWPRRDEQPLSFLGQFNLADLQGSPVARELPATGILSAFCLYLDDGNDDFSNGGWRLFYFPDATELVRRELDEELADESRFPACRVEYSEVLTLPRWWAAKEALQPEDVHPADDEHSEELTLPDWRTMEEGLKALRLEYVHPLGRGSDDVYSELYYDLGDRDHILGHSSPIQGDSLEGKGERHLLTVSGNEATGWNFAAGGALYFMIDEKRLKEGKFDRVTMKFDCG